ncbi:DHH family phosphoesterase [Candidatus Microgenomates bacterium]|nr:DHH family phosphoesterase [Candidatus Microgenomates bacterium]
MANLDQPLARFKELIAKSKVILIVQPERVDDDSMGSALALGQLLTDQGKAVSLYTFEGVPNHLRHYPGADKVTNKLPDQFDLVIIVDCGAPAQLARTLAAHKGQLFSKPLIVIDHHANRQPIASDALGLIDGSAGATAQQIVDLARGLGWQISKTSAQVLAAAIMEDTVHLTTKTTTARTIESVRYLVSQGADLEQVRLASEEVHALPVDMLSMKLELLKRASFHDNDRIGISYITQSEMKHLKDDLVLEVIKHELRQLRGVLVAGLVSERQDDYKVSLRSDIDVAGAVAKEFGGGGHDKAAGFVIKADSTQDAISKVVAAISQEIKKVEKTHATL